MAVESAGNFDEKGTIDNVIAEKITKYLKFVDQDEYVKIARETELCISFWYQEKTIHRCYL